MTKITPDDVRKVSQLARLDIADESMKTYANQLEKIIDYIAQLEKIDTKNIPPTTRAVEVVNVLRDDIVRGSDVKEEILNLAPQKEGRFYRVPRILSE